MHRRRLTYGLFFFLSTNCFRIVYFYTGQRAVDIYLLNFWPRDAVIIRCIVLYDAPLIHCRDYQFCGRCVVEVRIRSSLQHELNFKFLVIVINAHKGSVFSECRFKVSRGHLIWTSESESQFNCICTYVCCLFSVLA